MRFVIVLCALLASACAETEAKLVPDNWIEGDSISRSLTELAGDPTRGEVIFSDREGGHCVLCHAVEGTETPFQGHVGPNLTTVGARLTPGQLRLRIVDYHIVRPGTLMPSYYRIHDLHQVMTKHQSSPILPAQDVEDLVAYLSSLTVVNDAN